ncbi:hypothetical protein, partial [Shimia ponticola]|uniref:hypothetical protein n=1 Tax=Shimia ponticola TaxID=2582893 RepID=UPI001C9B8D29
FREEEGQEWVVVNAAEGTVKASGATAYEALRTAYQREQIEGGKADPFPRRCQTNPVTDFHGECAFCGAANGQQCLARIR